MGRLFLAATKTDMGVAYACAKAADDHMVRCMAHELRAHNVAAVAIYPGLVRTDGGAAADADVMKKSGQVLIAAEVAREYGFTDVDGRQPAPVKP